MSQRVFRKGKEAGSQARVMHRNRQLAPALRVTAADGVTSSSIAGMCNNQMLLLAPDHANQSLFHLILGLAYSLENDRANDRKGLAAMRCAASLASEQQNLLALPLAQLSLRMGDFVSARDTLWHLDPAELTGAENTLRVRILAQCLAPTSRRFDIVHDPCPDAASLLVIGDPDAISALWAPKATYWLCDPYVNGLTARHARVMSMQFDVGIATDEGKREAEGLGVCCTRWIEAQKPMAA